MTTTNMNNDTAESPQTPPIPPVAPDKKAATGKDNVALYLPSVLGYEKIARRAAEAVAEEMNFNQNRIEDLKTAVAEACMNAIEHGNHFERGVNVAVHMTILPDKLEVRVADIGRQQVPDKLPSPGSGDMRGWGFFFIQNLVDEMEIVKLPDGGNEIRMALYLTPRPAADASTEKVTAPAAEVATKTEAAPAPAAATPAPDIAQPESVETKADKKTAVKAKTETTEIDKAEKAESDPQAKALQPAKDKPRAVQPTKSKPKAVQPTKDKPRAVQPTKAPPNAVQPTKDKPRAVVPPVKKPSAIQPAPDAATGPTTPKEQASSTAQEDKTSPES